MAIDPNIKKKADDIRNKIYGKEVRESLASGLEEMSSDVVETVGRQDEVESQWQNVVDETTNLDVVSAPEIIAARDGELNLKNRLDKEHQIVAEELAQTNRKVDDDADSPDNYEGTDREKIQQAIDNIVMNKFSGGTIKLSRMYDLTGELPLVINKPVTPKRRPITFSGVGGGFEKHDAGFMFTSDDENTGDIYFNSVVFQSTSGAGVKVFDNDKLIRIFTDTCHFRRVDTIFYAPTRWLQSNYVRGGSIVGGEGNVIEAKRSYDLSFSDVLIEHRHNFLYQLPGTAQDKFTSTRIHNLIIEGLSGQVAYFDNVDSLLVDGCYFEDNKRGYFKFATDAVIYNTTFSNNRLTHWGGAVEDDPFDSFIHWGGTLTNVLSTNNYVRNISLHNTYFVTSGTILASAEDYNVKDTQIIVKYFDHPRQKTLETQNGTVRQIFYPTFTRSSFQSSNRTIGVGKITQIYDLGFKMNRDDSVSISLKNTSDGDNGKLRLVNYHFINGNLEVIIENTSSEPINFNVYISILAITPSYLG